MTMTSDTADSSEHLAASTTGLHPRSKRREEAACDALRALLRDVYTRQYGMRVPDKGGLQISLKLRVDPGNAWQVGFDPDFDTQVDRQFADAQAQWAVYLRGHVYCFRCESASCTHGVPPDPLHVFRGYSSTGVPEWCEMVQALVDAGDDRVDALYADPPQVLARMQTGHILKSQQLSSFGRSSRTYSVLAQVVAGYARLPAVWAARAGGTDRLALTLQAVETRGHKGRIRLALNRIIGGLTPDAMDELLVSEWQPGLRRALDSADWRLEDLQRRVDALGADASPAAIKDCLREVPGIMRQLARTIEQGVRQGGRRTRHVEERRAQQRPVHKALEDARTAGAGSVFADEKKGTIVVCGRQNRAHAFNAEGKHVTSFVLGAGGAQFRVRTRRWRALDADELARFHACIADSRAAVSISEGAVNNVSGQTDRGNARFTVIDS